MDPTWIRADPFRNCYTGMSREHYNADYLERHETMARGGGLFWERIDPPQRKLMEAMRRAALPWLGQENNEAAMRWFSQGGYHPSFPIVTTFDPVNDVRLCPPGRWGTLHQGCGPVIANTDGEDAKFLTSDGEVVTIKPGKAFDVADDPANGFLVVDGRVVVIFGGAPPAQDPASVLSQVGGSLLLGLRDSIRLPDPVGIPDVKSARFPASEELGPPLLDEFGQPFTDGSGGAVTSEGEDSATGDPVWIAAIDETGNPVLDELGGPVYTEFIPVTERRYLVLARQAAWAVRFPQPWYPAALESAKGPLVEGTGFIVGEGSIYVFEDPTVLWPTGIIWSRSSSPIPATPHAYQTRSHSRSSSHKHAYRYLRSEPGEAAFLRAVAEGLGLTVADWQGDKTIVRIENHGTRSAITFGDGSHVVCRGPAVRRIGEVVAAGDVVNGWIRLRSERRQGPSWFRNRPWAIQGIPLKIFWSWAPADVLVQDRMVPVQAYLDSGVVRARALMQGATDDLWDEHLRREKRSGANWAVDVLGLEDVQDAVEVNMLELLMAPIANRAMCVEGLAGSFDQQLWRDLISLVDEMKPCGSIAFVGPTYIEAADNPAR